MKLYDKLALAISGLVFIPIALIIILMIAISARTWVASDWNTDLITEVRLDEQRVVVTDSTQALNEEEQQWFTSWEKRRGIETKEYHNQLILLKGDISEVVEILAPAFNSWDKNILGKEVMMDRRGAFVFQLKGHDWTEIVSWDFVDKLLAQQLSKNLNRPTLYYAVHDYDAPTEYTYFEAGQIVEQSSNDLEDRAICNHTSSINPSIVPLTKNCDVDELFQTLDLLEPGIAFDYFLDYQELKIGEETLVQNPGFTLVISPERELKSTPRFRRVDYFTDR